MNEYPSTLQIYLDRMDNSASAVAGPDWFKANGLWDYLTGPLPNKGNIFVTSPP